MIGPTPCPRGKTQAVAAGHALPGPARKQAQPYTRVAADKQAPIAAGSHRAPDRRRRTARTGHATPHRRAVHATSQSNHEAPPPINTQGKHHEHRERNETYQLISMRMYARNVWNRQQQSVYTKIVQLWLRLGACAAPLRDSTMWLFNQTAAVKVRFAILDQPALKGLARFVCLLMGLKSSC